MKHISTFLLIGVLIIMNTFALQAQLQINGTTYQVDTTAHFDIGPGSTYSALTLTAHNRLDVYFVKVDATNPYISFQSVLGNDYILTGERPSSMAQRKSREGAIYFAGTNGDFYVTQGDVGLPIGAAMVGQQLAYTPNNNRKLVTFDTQNMPRIGNITYSGNISYDAQSYAINHVNYNRNTNELVLYNEHQGASTRTNAYGIEVRVRLAAGVTWGVNKNILCVVDSVQVGVGNMPIPKGYAVLSANGTAQTALNSLAVGDTMTIAINMAINGISSDYTTGVAGEGRALMLSNGVVERVDVWNENHPRTGFGHSITGDTIIFCVVDGRGVSAGCTTETLAELMLSAGAHNAINLDGGGSSCIYVKEFGQLNTGSDGAERAVSNGLFAVSSAPSNDSITIIKSYTRSISVPHFGIFKPKILGYNQYGTLLDTDLKGCVLSCPPAMGYIDTAGYFVASGSVGGPLTITYNGNVVTTVNIVLAASAPIKLRLDSVLIDNDFNYSIEVQSHIENSTITVLPAALTWIVEDPSICQVNNGILTGLANGTTRVFGSLGSFSDTLKVMVELPSTPRMVWDDFASADQNWGLISSLASWNAQFITGAVGTLIDFDFTNTRGAYLKLTQVAPLYSLPDSIQFVLNTQAAKLSKVIIGLRANDQTSSKATTFENIPRQTDVALTIKTSSLVPNINDIAIYPIWMDYITMNLDASQMTSGTKYSINIKEIALYYGNITVGIDNPTLMNQLTVYPNPVVGGEAHLKLKLNQPTEVRMDIITLSGQVIRSSYLGMQYSGDILLPLHGLTTGTYFVKLYLGNIRQETIKLIIQ